MKNKLHILGLMLGIFMAGTMASCGSDDAPATPQDELITNERPTDWAAVTEGIDPQSTMTADVKVDLSSLGLTYEMDEQDMMAAFTTGKCCAVAKPTFTGRDSTTASTRYVLTIKKLLEAGSDTPVTLKFYSAKLKHVFTSQGLTFEDEGAKGTYDEPYTPEWSK